MIGSSIKNTTDLTKHLLELKQNDVLFCDEIHSMPRRLEEILYPALEDRVITTQEKGFDDLMKQIGVQTRDKSVTTHYLPPFTFIGATTLLGLVSPPLRSRFGQILELEPYVDCELQTIIAGVATKLAFELPSDLALGIAARSRGTARIAVTNLMWFRDFVMADGGVGTKEGLDAAFELKGVDANGLGRTDREYLRRLVESAEPVGLETIASSLGEQIETIETAVEPFLLRQGYLSKTTRGRVPTPKARQLMEEEAK
jgi:Holliday junction DNA helicase RuvB